MGFALPALTIENPATVYALAVHAVWVDPAPFLKALFYIANDFMFNTTLTTTPLTFVSATFKTLCALAVVVAVVFMNNSTSSPVVGLFF